MVLQTPSFLQVLPHTDKKEWDHPHRMHTSAPDETDFFAIGVQSWSKRTKSALFLFKTIGASHLHESKLRPLRLGEKTVSYRCF